MPIDLLEKNDPFELMADSSAARDTACKMTFTRFEEIDAWQAARQLSRRLERIIRSSNLNRDFTLRDQIRAAVNSMMANIAEGHSRRSDREFAHFLFIAKASAAELESHLYCAYDREYVSEACLQELLNHAEGYARMVSGLFRICSGSRLGRQGRLGRPGRRFTSRPNYDITSNKDFAIMIR